MAGIPELWLVNLTDTVIEVHRRPLAGRYADIVQVDLTGELRLAAFPEVGIPVAGILP